jgi:photosystem II stability/assembly factor-like uncharacterized protein
VKDGVASWPTLKGLLVSRDEGKTWSIQGQEIELAQGPMFGKSAEHLVAVNKQGFQETKDGGKSWKKVASLPDGFTVATVGPNYAWDPVNDLFYASSMGKDTYRFRRSK